MYISPFQVTVNRKGKSSGYSRGSATFAAATLLLFVSFIFVLVSVSSRGKPLENVKDSLMVELLAKEALNEVNLCSTGTHQSPIDLPESGTKLDELPFFGWTNDESPANTVELIDNNAFQVMGTGSLPTPLLLFQYLREALRLSFNYFRSYCAGTGRWGTIHSPGS